MRLALIAEAHADAVSARRLADRVLIESGPDWVADPIESLRSWTGLNADTSFTAWHDLKRHTKSYSVTIHGRNRGRITQRHGVRSLSQFLSPRKRGSTR